MDGIGINNDDYHALCKGEIPKRLKYSGLTTLTVDITGTVLPIREIEQMMIENTVPEQVDRIELEFNLVYGSSKTSLGRLANYWNIYRPHDRVALMHHILNNMLYPDNEYTPVNEPYKNIID